jgi:hypothetical protein
VVTLTGAVGLTAVDAAKDAGSKAKVAAFELDKQVVATIRSGSLQFTVDQQPHLQGYLAVASRNSPRRAPGDDHDPTGCAGGDHAAGLRLKGMTAAGPLNVCWS